MLLGYVAERVDDGLTLYTSTADAVGKHEIGLLSAGEWPCWAAIVEAVPEFDQTHVVFDAVSRNEWSRRWDLTLQQHRAQGEEGIFG
jgi:predicted lipoprotein with Yx(FWY)xxD motif